jgi:cobalt transporter subunit CbtA
MTFFRNVVFIAAVAGLVAGLAMTAMQSFATVPLIIQAESFEGAAHSHAHGYGGDAASAPADHSHGEDEASWAPADGFERLFYTGLANVVTAIGFALLLVAASEFAGGIAGWRQGMIWGFAGFAIFTLAPGLGLPPELPAMPAADVAARQIWWTAAVAATAAGLAMIAFSKHAAPPLLGVALIVVPHVIGAPQPESHESPVPGALHQQFVVAVTVTSLTFWVILGAAAGIVRSRFLRLPASLGASLA